MAEIKEYIDNYNKGYSDGDNYKVDALKTLLQDIDFFFETKEVDLEKEIHNYLDNHGLNIQDGGRIVFDNGDTPNFLFDFRDIAKYFYELGLAQKGE
jgi:hypothetical protein